MGELKVLLLGTPEVYWDGQPLEIRRRIPRKILYYLAAHEYALGRAELLPLFWPESDEASARAGLRDNLSKLRAELPDPTLLITDITKVSLDHSRVSVDLLEFLKIIEVSGRTPWQIPLDQPLPQDVYNELTRAINMWRAPHFMSGVTLPDNLEYEEWVRNLEKNSIHSLIHILQRVARHCLVTRNFSDCIKWLHMLLDNDPFNEEYHTQLIKTLLAMGNRDEAYSYGQKVKESFLTEIGEPPSPELLSLIKQLEKTAVTPPIRYEIDRNQGGDLPLIGQDDLLENLLRFYQRGGVVFLSGDTGSGKSRIASVFAKQIGPSAKFIKAICHPQQRIIPFQPFVQMMREYFNKGSFSDLPNEWINGLKSIYPDLPVSTFREPPAEYHIEIGSQAVLLEAIRSLVIKEAESNRLVILLDDAHWCDESTLATFAYLFDNNAFPSCGLLIVTSNPAYSNESLGKFQNDLLNHHPAISETVTVPPLNQQGIKQISQMLSDRPLAANIVSKVHAFTGGNPLFAIETLRSMIKAGHRNQNDASELNIEVPPSIQNILMDRFDALSDRSRSILYTSAIMGVDIDQDLLEKASFHTPEEIVDVLEELESAKIIRIQKSPGQIKPNYTFTQHIFREAIINNLSAPRLRLIHKRVAHALKDLSQGIQDKNASILAEHFEAGGELEEAFQAWVAAGTYAKRMLSLDEEIRAYERAEKLLSSTEMLLTDQQIMGLFAPWILTAYMLHDIPMLTRISRVLFNLGKQRGSPLLSGYGLYGLANSCFSQNDYAETIRYIDEALIYLAKSASPYYYAQALARKGSALYMQNQFEDALKMFTEALSFSNQDSLEAERARGVLNHQIAAIHTFMGNPDVGYFHADLALKSFIQTGDLHGQVDSYSIKVLASFYKGNYEHALNLGTVALEIARRLKFWRMIGYIQAFSGFAYATLGDLDSAYQCAVEAEDLGIKYHHADLLSAAYRLFGDIFRFLRDHEMAAQYYRKGWECCENHFVGLDNLARLGYQLCFIGKKQEGIQFVRQAHQFAQKLGLGTVMISAQLYEIDRLMSEIPGTFSMEKLEGIRQDCVERTLPSQQMVAMGLIAYRELRQKQTEIALNIFKEIVGMASDLNDPWTEIVANFALTQIRGQLHPDRLVLLSRNQELVSRITAHTTQPHLQKSLQKFIHTIDKITSQN